MAANPSPCSFPYIGTDYIWLTRGRLSTKLVVAREYSVSYGGVGSRGGPYPDLQRVVNRVDVVAERRAYSLLLFS